ncbi:MAG: sialate O-acetylesterase [Planctomycetota bacterium]|nr:sialate O-acetylesterase [Planctomycetota bacterium]MDG1985875.1 sialate O-acetylesterase [Planctomycetota bacterium]
MKLLHLLSALLLAPSLATASGEVKVFILAGQSNMEGKAQLPLLQHLATQPSTAARFAHLRDGEAWRVRDDVWIDFLGRRGPLTVGYGSPNRVGLELDFGHLVGDHFEEPVLLIKAAWGGRSLYRDFRPPSAGLPGDEVLERLLVEERKKSPERTREEVQGSFGRDYRGMLREVERAMGEAREAFPGMGDGAFQLSGFIWFQGWNDMVNDVASAEYSRNLGCLIRDVRRDLKAPGLPFVVGQLGVGGLNRPEPGRDRFKAAQAAPMDLPEFRSNTALVRTDQFWDEEAQAVFDKGWRDHFEEWEKVGSDFPFHYLGSPRTYGDIGRALAEAALALDAARGR